MSTAHKGKIAFSDGVHWIYKPHLGQPPLPAVDSQQEMTAIILGDFCLKCFIWIIFFTLFVFCFNITVLSFVFLWIPCISLCDCVCVFPVYSFFCFIYRFVCFFLSVLCCCLLVVFLCSFVCLVLFFVIVFSSFLPKEKERRLKVG